MPLSPQELYTRVMRLPPAQQAQAIEHLIGLGFRPKPNATQAKPDMRLADYIRAAWHVVEPATPYLHNWHIDAIAEHLEAVSAGQLRRLLITVPPRTGKSTSVSVFWPTWMWTFRPSSRWLCASHGYDLAIRDSLSARRVIDSQWYQSRWSKVFAFASDQNAKTRFQNTRGGHRIALSVQGGGIGEGGDYLLLDDPNDPKAGEADRDAAISWFDQVWSLRQNDPKTAAMVIIMQRLHERDIAGHVLERGGWTELCLPMEFEPQRRCVTVPLGGRTEPWADPRTTEGELLFPARFGVAEVAEAKKMGLYVYPGQYQQRPAPIHGGIWKREWWRTYHTDRCGHEGARLPLPLGSQLLSWDCTFKDLDTSDYVVGQVWGASGANAYLLDQVREQMSFTQTLVAFRNQCERWPEATTRLVEDKANGTAVLDILRTTIPGLIAVEPEGGKEARAVAVAPMLEAGNVWLPCTVSAPWIDAFLEEASLFPRGAHDDQVDAASQALRRFQRRPVVVAPGGTATESLWGRF